ncbi:hypothetical protein OH77DRAFT_956586 [Trametes cingulata]|nr:hypothetical protein OH77DRAFT_956586 [Trametes cingulata]
MQTPGMTSRQQTDRSCGRSDCGERLYCGKSGTSHMSPCHTQLSHGDFPTGSLHGPKEGSRYRWPRIYRDSSGTEEIIHVLHSKGKSFHTPRPSGPQGDLLATPVIITNASAPRARGRVQNKCKQLPS